MKIMTYASALAVSLWVLAHGLIAVSLIVGLFVLESGLVAALGVAAALMMAWPLMRQLTPVAYSVVVRGTWPNLPSR